MLYPLPVPFDNVVNGADLCGSTITPLNVIDSDGDSDELGLTDPSIEKGEQAPSLSPCQP